ncbi:MAG: hypothetical protein AB1758_11745 [Candidatus Eremiobacterota bacterium]
MGFFIPLLIIGGIQLASSLIQSHQQNQMMESSRAASDQSNQMLMQMWQQSQQQFAAFASAMGYPIPAGTENPIAAFYQQIGIPQTQLPGQTQQQPPTQVA